MDANSVEEMNNSNVSRKEGRDRRLGEGKWKKVDRFQ
jgi:hypothetical protein